MKKILKVGMFTGINIMATIVPEYKDLVILLIQKILGLSDVSIKPIYALLFGFLLFLICLINYKKITNKERIINIVGFGNNDYWENNNNNVETIDVRDWKKKYNKTNYLKKELKNVDIIINKYLASGLSFTSIAPIPIVALFGTHFSKIGINDYYEYWDSISKVKALNDRLFFPKLRLSVKNENTDKSYALITIATTADINAHQIKQFNNCLHYKNTINKTHQNSIYSKKQLYNYSNKIIEQINIISSKEKIQRIYIIFATQSCLPFEIGKQLNDRIAKEIVVCHYQNDLINPYKWGIVLNGKNKEKYIELGSDI